MRFLVPTEKDVLSKLRTEEQKRGGSSDESHSIVLLAAEGLHLEKQWSV